jgi:hypothetical protein
MDTSPFDKIQLPVRPIKTGKKLGIKIGIEDIHTKKQQQTEALIDSSCMRTCIDAKFAKEVGFILTKVPKPILVEYADRTTVEGSTIRYSVNIRIRTAGVTVVTGVLVT